MRSYPPLVRRVLLTLAYYDQFQFPLTIEEVCTRLIGLPKVSNKFVFKSILWLLVQGLINVERRNTQLFVQLRYRHGFTAQRTARYHFSNQKLQELQPLLKFAQFVPWIEAIAVTGSVAVKNAQLAADTDLLVVTRPGSLWLVRPMLILYAWVCGKRRSWRAEEPNSWCFNLWLESTKLSVEPKVRSVYTAQEVVQTLWVWDRAAVASEFKAKNAWVSKVVPRLYECVTNEKDTPLQLSSISDALLEVVICITEPLWRVLNSLLYLMQRLYMYPHKTRERVSFRAAFFHPRDTRFLITKAWKSSISQLKVKPEQAQRMHAADQLPADVSRLLETARAAGQKIVLVTGVFDILHEEHVIFLEKAARQGDFLLVGIESDVRVRAIKGKNRPVFSEEIRAQQIAAIPVVHTVIVLPTSFALPNEHNAFLQVVRPDILAVSEQSSHIPVKRRAVEAIGGSLVVVHDHNPLISTTQLLAEQDSSHDE